MSKYKYITLREKPQLKDRAAEWFHSKWGVPQEAYLNSENEYQAIGGLEIRIASSK